jgi:hypothetical protein
VSRSGALSAESSVKYLSVKKHGGAKGDGTTDDTSAINNTYADAVAEGMGVLFDPGGGYLVSGAGLHMNANAHVPISGYGATVIPAANATGITFDPGITTGDGLGLAMEGLLFRPTGAQTQTAIKIRNASRLAARDINVYGGQNGILFSNDGAGGYCEDNHLENIYIASAAVGLKFEAINGGSVSLEENTFNHVSVAGCTTGVWQGPGLEFRDLFMLSLKVWATMPGSQTCFLLEGDITDWVALLHVENLAPATGNTAFHFTSTATNPDKGDVAVGDIGNFATFCQVDAGTVGFVYRKAGSRRWGGKVGGTALSARRDTDTQDRFQLLASPAGIILGAGGATAPDSNLYRNAANQLKTDDQLVVADGVATKTKAGVPADGDFTAAPGDGTIAVRTSSPLGAWFRANGLWRSANPAPVNIPLMAMGTAATWTSMPAADTEIMGSTRQRVWSDLSNAVEARLTLRVATAGATGSTIRAQYSTDNGATWADLGTSVAIDVTGTNANAKSGWVALPGAAKTDVLIRLMGLGGDGATSPSFGVIALQVR